MRSDLAVFEALCKKHSRQMLKKEPSKDPLRNVVFVTTMWDQVDEQTGSQYEKELKNKYWKGMISQGATTARYDGTSDTAWKIIEHCMQGGDSQLV